MSSDVTYSRINAHSAANEAEFETYLKEKYSQDFDVIIGEPWVHWSESVLPASVFFSFSLLSVVHWKSNLRLKRSQQQRECPSKQGWSTRIPSNHLWWGTHERSDPGYQQLSWSGLGCVTTFIFMLFKSHFMSRVALSKQCLNENRNSLDGSARER